MRYQAPSDDLKPDSYNEVVLRAFLAGEAPNVSHSPIWYERCRVDGRIEIVNGSEVDGRERLYLKVWRQDNTVEYAKWDMIVGMFPDGDLYVREQGRPPERSCEGYNPRWM